MAIKDKIKNWLGITKIEDDILNKELIDLQIEAEENTIENFLRHELASIDLEDVRDKDRSEQEIKEYNAGIASVFKSCIQPAIKRYIIEQEKFMARNAKTVEELSFGRGTINGLLILEEEFENAFNEHNLSHRPPEPFDESKLFADIPEPKVDGFDNQPS